MTISPTTTREFTGFRDSTDNIIEIIPGVDSERFCPGFRPDEYIRKYHLEGKEILITVSRLVERKGHDLVLRAMNLLKDRKNLHYVIVGAGEDRVRLENITTELGLVDRVTFTGSVRDSELPDYYRLGDIFVMPNREVVDIKGSIEGFGITFIEAGACGRPVIAGRSGGAVDAVVNGVTGYTIDPENPSECADKIVYLLDHPDVRNDMGCKGRERAVKQFNWKPRAEMLMEAVTINLETVRESKSGRNV